MQVDGNNVGILNGDISLHLGLDRLAQRIAAGAWNNRYGSHAGDTDNSRWLGVTDKLKEAFGHEESFLNIYFLRFVSSTTDVSGAKCTYKVELKVVGVDVFQWKRSSCSSCIINQHIHAS